MNLSESLFPGMKNFNSARSKSDFSNLMDKAWFPKGGTMFYLGTEGYIFYGTVMGDILSSGGILASPIETPTVLVFLEMDWQTIPELSYEAWTNRETKTYPDYFAKGIHMKDLTPAVANQLLNTEFSLNNLDNLNRLTNMLSNDRYEDPTGIKKIKNYGKR